MSDYEQLGNDAERDADEMQERSKRLEAQIDRTRDDWERSKRDPMVPTADDPQAREEDVPPEADEGGG